MPAFPQRSRAAFRPRLVLGVLAAILCSPPLLASPLLRCQIEHVGVTTVHDFAPVSDPYRAKAIDIDERFRFKAVVIGDAQAIEYVKLYAYYWDWKKGRPILLHQAHHRAPVAQANPSPDALGGWHSLYSGDRERELRYACALHESAP